MARSELSAASEMLRSALEREHEAQQRSRQAEAVARDAKHTIVEELLRGLAKIEHNNTAVLKAEIGRAVHDLVSQLDELAESLGDTLTGVTERVEAALLHERDAATTHRAEIARSVDSLADEVAKLTAIFTTAPAASDPTVMTLEEHLALANSKPELKAAFEKALADYEFENADIEFH